MIMKWGQDLKEVDKFVRIILDLHKSIESVVSIKQTAVNDDLKTLVNQMKLLFS